MEGGILPRKNGKNQILISKKTEINLSFPVTAEFVCRTATQSMSYKWFLRDFKMCLDFAEQVATYHTMRVQHLSWKYILQIIRKLLNRKKTTFPQRLVLYHIICTELPTSCNEFSKHLQCRTDSTSCISLTLQIFTELILQAFLVSHIIDG